MAGGDCGKSQHVDEVIMEVYEWCDKVKLVP